MAEHNRRPKNLCADPYPDGDDGPPWGPRPPVYDGLVTYGEEREPSPRGVDRRNVGVIGSPDAGKTTLVERAVRDAGS